MIIFAWLLAVVPSTATTFYPSVTFLEERPGPERLPHLQRLVDDADRGRCSVFFEFLPRRINADASAKNKTLRQLFESKTKFAYVFGMESEALKILEIVGGLYVGLRDEDYRDLGAHAALADAIAEIGFRSSLKKETSLQRWRKLVDLGHPLTIFQRTSEMSREELMDFLRAFYAVLVNHVRMDRAAYLEVDLDEFPRGASPRDAVEVFFDRAMKYRNAYMAESIVNCEKALARPIKVALHPGHVDKMTAEFREVWPGLDVSVVRESKSFGLGTTPPRP